MSLDNHRSTIRYVPRENNIGDKESILIATLSGADNVVGSLTFHQLTIILCGAFTAATFIFSGALLFLHETHFSNPGQQTQYEPQLPQ